MIFSNEPLIRQSFMIGRDGVRNMGNQRFTIPLFLDKRSRLEMDILQSKKGQQ